MHYILDGQSIFWEIQFSILVCDLAIIDGEQIKSPPDISGDSIIGKYEVSGFDVEYDTGKNIRSVSIRDYFQDLETAMMSINGDKYLIYQKLI